MSNQIQIRRGLDAERVVTAFANGELVWTTDTKTLYVGDGVTPGGCLANAQNLAYVRNAYSQRFNEQINVTNIIDALDVIFNFVTSTSTSFFHGEVSSNDTITDDVSFIQSLISVPMPNTLSELDISHVSSNTYRVFAYPVSYGALSDIQDLNFNYASIRNSYEATPRQVTYQTVTLYVYMTLEKCYSPTGKTIRYLF